MSRGTWLAVAKTHIVIPDLDPESNPHCDWLLMRVSPGIKSRDDNFAWGEECAATQS